MKGDSTVNSAGVYGTKGLAAPGNHPGARFSSAYWTDLSGNLWLFGGSGAGQFSHLNDLWKYVPGTNLWTWVKGDNFKDAPGFYGQKGIASPLNQPPPRYRSTSWTDKKVTYGFLVVRWNQDISEISTMPT
jgi:hypothetical protein